MDLINSEINFERLESLRRGSISSNISFGTNIPILVFLSMIIVEKYELVFPGVGKIEFLFVKIYNNFTSLITNFQNKQHEKIF